MDRFISIDSLSKTDNFTTGTASNSKLIVDRTFQIRAGVIIGIFWGASITMKRTVYEFLVLLVHFLSVIVNCYIVLELSCYLYFKWSSKLIQSVTQLVNTPPLNVRVTPHKLMNFCVIPPVDFLFVRSVNKEKLDRLQEQNISTFFQKALKSSEITDLEPEHPSSSHRLRLPSCRRCTESLLKWGPGYGFPNLKHQLWSKGNKNEGK